MHAALTPSDTDHLDRTMRDLESRAAALQENLAHLTTEMKGQALPDCLDSATLADLRDAEGLAAQIRLRAAAARTEADKLVATIGIICAAIRGNAERH